jgi:outer membrane protein OmpA-like peptidoglycan-associated protein
MLGGNELSLKKDDNMMEQFMEREEWMNKGEDNMSEDEKVRYREFLQKEADFKEKQRKQWKQKLNLFKADVAEIKAKFEEEINELYKKRLFYEARIYEQELYIIRLIIMLGDIKVTKENKVNFAQDLEKNEEEYQEKLINHQQLID